LLNVLNPARRNTTVSSDRLTVLAEVRNVSSNEEMEVIHNNQVVNFTYDPVSFRLSCPLQLTVGINPVTITVTTPNGREQEQIAINYQPDTSAAQTESTPRSGGQTPNRGGQNQIEERKVEDNRTPRTTPTNQRPVRTEPTEPTTRPSQSAPSRPVVKEPVKTSTPSNSQPSKPVVKEPVRTTPAKPNQPVKPKVEPTETPKPKSEKPGAKSGGE